MHRRIRIWDSVNTEQLGERNQPSRRLFCYVTLNNRVGWVSPDLSKQSRCFGPRRAAPAAGTGSRYPAGPWVRVLQLCKAPADPVLRRWREGTADGDSQNPVWDLKTQARTANEAPPLPVSYACVGTVPDSFKSWRRSKIYILQASFLCSVFLASPLVNGVSPFLAGRLPWCVLERTVQGAKTLLFQNFSSMHTKWASWNWKIWGNQAK